MSAGGVKRWTEYYSTPELVEQLRQIRETRAPFDTSDIEMELAVRHHPSTKEDTDGA